MTLSNFENYLKLSEKSFQIFQKSIDHYRIGHRNFFIDPENQKYIKLESCLVELLRSIFLKNENVQIFAIYDRNKQEFFFYHMQQLLDIFKKSCITFSKNGIIKIGNYLTLQRKGGDGNYTKLPKNHINHPSLLNCI